MLSRVADKGRKWIKRRRMDGINHYSPKAAGFLLTVKQETYIQTK